MIDITDMRLVYEYYETSWGSYGLGIPHIKYFLQVQLHQQPQWQTIPLVDIKDLPLADKTEMVRQLNEQLKAKL